MWTTHCSSNMSARFFRLLSVSDNSMPSVFPYSLLNSNLKSNPSMASPHVTVVKHSSFVLCTPWSLVCVPPITWHLRLVAELTEGRTDCSIMFLTQCLAHCKRPMNIDQLNKHEWKRDVVFPVPGEKFHQRIFVWASFLPSFPPSFLPSLSFNPFHRLA